MYRNRNFWGVVLAAVVLLCGCGRIARPRERPQHPDHRVRSASARIVATELLTKRQVDLTVESPAVGGRGQGAAVAACPLPDEEEEPALARAVPLSRLLR